MKHITDVYFWTGMRLVLGFMFLWAFFDKLFGLGFATAAEKAWLRGGSPTAGFLKLGVSGPFSDFFHALSGSAWVDCLFMFGLLAVGTALILGVALRLAGYGGAVMVFLMWLAVLPPKNNPLIDDHIIYLIIFLGIIKSSIRSEDYFGIGKWWKSTAIVKKLPFLQ